MPGQMLSATTSRGLLRYGPELSPTITARSCASPHNRIICAKASCFPVESSGRFSLVEKRYILCYAFNNLACVGPSFYNLALVDSVYVSKLVRP